MAVLCIVEGSIGIRQSKHCETDGGPFRFVSLPPVLAALCLVTDDVVSLCLRWLGVVVLLAYVSGLGSFNHAGLVLRVRSPGSDLTMGTGTGAGIGIILSITRSEREDIFPQHNTTNNIHQPA